MTKSFLLATAAALLAAPLAFAHNPDGTPKNYCEDPSEWNVHDYGPPATGQALFLLTDGNLLGDCNGDGVPADFDDHSEFAFGGAWLMVDSGDGVTRGSVACYGEVGHHPQFGPFGAVDAVFGATVPITVGADTESLTPPTDPAEPDCGDFTTDHHTTLFPYGIVTFPCGLDGAYIVYVGDSTGGAVGTLGHVFSP